MAGGIAGLGALAVRKGIEYVKDHPEQVKALGMKVIKHAAPAVAAGIAHKLKKDNTLHSSSSAGVTHADAKTRLEHSLEEELSRAWTSLPPEGRQALHIAHAASLTPSTSQGPRDAKTELQGSLHGALSSAWADLSVTQRQALYLQDTIRQELGAQNVPSDPGFAGVLAPGWDRAQPAELKAAVGQALRERADRAVAGATALGLIAAPASTWAADAQAAYTARQESVGY